MNVKETILYSVVIASIGLSNIYARRSVDDAIRNPDEVKIVMIGAGYVGLVTGACFAAKQYAVTVVEKDQRKINALHNRQIPFYEPDLVDLVDAGFRRGSLKFSDNIASALASAPHFIFLCVGTPPLPDGSADLTFVRQAAQEIGANLQEYAIVITKSTVPVGSADMVKAEIQNQLTLRNTDILFDVASNPEFLKEGEAVKDFFEPDRVVIGAGSEQVHTLMSALYRPFVKTNNQLICMNIPSAELTKYAANAMLATRISFMNQMALLADKVGADVEAVRAGIASDTRIGPEFLKAGIGYGGSCFPKDVTALADMGRQHDQPMTLIEAVDAVNLAQREYFIKRIFDHYNGNVAGKTIGILGLAFKPNTDDIRCAPSIDVMKALIAAGALVVAYDPVARENMQRMFEQEGIKGQYCFVNAAIEILHDADAVIILTQWDEFKRLPAQAFASLRDKVVFDGRNIFDPISMTSAGLTYITIGRNMPR